MSDDARNIIAQAYKAYKAGELDKAKVLVRQALQLDPNNANGWFVAGLVSTEEKNKRRAFEKALALDPQHKYARAALETMTLPLDPAAFAIPTTPSTPPGTAASEHTANAERMTPLTDQSFAAAPKKLDFDTLKWLLLSVAITAGIGLVAMIVTAMRSQLQNAALTLSSTLPPTALVLMQPTIPPTATDTATPILLVTRMPSLSPQPTRTQAPTNTKRPTFTPQPTRTQDPRTPTTTPSPRVGLAATVYLTTVTPPPTVVADSSMTGQFLIASPNDLYTVNADGSRLVNIASLVQDRVATLNPALAGLTLVSSAQWSPDQQQMLVVINSMMILMNAHGVILREIYTPGLSVGSAVWSPDGKQVALLAAVNPSDQNRTLYIINADNSGLHQVTKTALPYQSLDWSPDGKTLLYTIAAAAENSAGLWGISPQGGEPRLIASLDMPQSALYSPDGKHILIRTATQYYQSYQLVMVDADGTNRRDLLSVRSFVSAMAWSPDGTQFAYIIKGGAGYDLYMTALEGGESSHVSLVTMDPTGLDWSSNSDTTQPTLVQLPSPDDAIAFVKTTTNPVYSSLTRSDIYLLNAFGQQQRVTTFAEAISEPSWSSDGQIAFVASGGPYAAPRIHVMNIDGSDLHQINPDNPDSFDDNYAPTSPSWSPDSRQIAYVRNGSLYVMQKDGTLDHEVGKFSYIEGRISWSPDGRQLLVYGTPESGTPENQPSGVYVIDVKGGNRQLLSDLPGGSPVWSPDGTQIAFFAKPDYYMPFSIYIMGLQGTPRPILNETFDEFFSVAWSPDGAHLVFSAKRKGMTTLYVMNADGTDPHAVIVDQLNNQANLEPQWVSNVTTRVNAAPPSSLATPPPPPTGVIAFTGKGGLCFAKPDGSVTHCVQAKKVMSNLTWSPDGKRLAFVGGFDKSADIFVMDADGSVRQLTISIFADTAPTWSPDGKQIAYIGGDVGQEQVFVMNADGSDKHAITRLGFSVIRLQYASIAWSPREDTIMILLSPNSAQTGTYLINTDGSNLHKINTQVGNGLTFSPDGQKVAFVKLTSEAALIMVMDADGGHVQELTHNDSYTIQDHFPTWSPDGNYIVFSTTRLTHTTMEAFDLFIVNADGSDPHQLGMLQGASPAWGIADAAMFALPK